MNAFFTICACLQNKNGMSQFLQFYMGKKPYANRNFIAYDVPLAARCLAGIRFTLYKIKKSPTYILCL